MSLLNYWLWIPLKCIYIVTELCAGPMESLKHKLSMSIYSMYSLIFPIGNGSQSTFGWHWLRKSTDIWKIAQPKVYLRIQKTKLLEENIGKKLSDINHSKILYDPPPRVMEIKAKINKWDLIKLKSFCLSFFA